MVRLTGLSAEAAWTVLAVAGMSAAAYGTVKLGARLGLAPVPRLAAGVFFLFSPSVFGMESFGSTFWGIVLIPAAVWCQIKAGEWVRIGWARRTWVVPVWATGCFALLALDGYAFVMAQAATAILLIAQGAGRSPARWAWPMGVFAAANVAGFFGYRFLFPTMSDVARSPIELFRAMGLDIVTLIWPSKYQWWFPRSAALDSGVLWGDGTNSTTNYVGLVFLTVAIVGAVVCARKRRRQAAAWLAIAAVAVVLALGPSLKVHDIRGALPSEVAYASYLMPADAATVSLPTAPLFTRVPGLEGMRATYRWYALVRLAEALFAAYGLQVLARRGRRWRVAAICIGVTGFLELSPLIVPGSSHITRQTANAAAVSDVDRSVISPIDAALPDKARVILAPNSTSHNDYMASYIATGAHVRMYNVGGDKTLALASPTWPESVAKLFAVEDDPRAFAELAHSVLADGTVEAVIVPRFDLRWSTSVWPPTDEYIARADAALAALADDDRFAVEDHPRLAIVTLKP
jgi:hypothetical protein